MNKYFYSLSIIASILFISKTEAQLIINPNFENYNVNNENFLFFTGWGTNSDDLTLGQINGVALRLDAYLEEVTTCPGGFSTGRDGSLVCIGGYVTSNVLVNQSVEQGGTQNIRMIPKSIKGNYTFSSNNNNNSYTAAIRVSGRLRDQEVNQTLVLNNIGGMVEEFELAITSYTNTSSNVSEGLKITIEACYNCPQELGETTTLQIDDLKYVYLDACPTGNYTVNDKIDLLAIEGCSTISGDLVITQNADTTNKYFSSYNDITPLYALNDVQGSLSIYHNFLTNLDGLENLESVGNNLVLSGPQITTYTGLEGLTEIPGNLLISSNQISNLTGLNNITSIGGGLTITSNSLLSSLQALSNVTFIGNSDPQALSSIFFNNNPQLTTLSGLEQVESLGGKGVYISNNTNLTDISAIAMIDPSTIGNIDISNNINLSNCAIASVCGKIGLNKAQVSINNNASNCENIVAVENLCELLSTRSSTFAENAYELYPNPFSSKVYLSIPVSAVVSIYDALGNKVYDKSHLAGEVIIDNLQSLSSGIYLLKVSDDEGILFAEKLIK